MLEKYRNRQTTLKMVKFYVKILMLAAIASQAAVPSSRAQATYEPHAGDQRVSSSSISFPRTALEKLANLTQEDNLWLLIPSNVSESQLHESDFTLFKLNTGRLLLNENGGGPGDGWVSAEAQVDVNGGDQPEAGVRSPRSARKLNLFKNVLGKPQVSPLYLVNGTVCRFVNSQPICTTLSTTGLFRGQNQGLLQQQGGNPFSLFQGNNNNNQQQQQQQGQLQNNQLLQPNQRQVSPQQAQQNGQFQQFRPMAVLDNEQQAVNVATAGGETNLTSRTPQVHRPTSAPSTTRPIGYQAALRRPLNLLSLGRPFRSG